jgi:hypothetical protein
VRTWRPTPLKRSDGAWTTRLVPSTFEQWASDEGEQMSRITARRELRPADPAAVPPEGKLIKLDVTDGGADTVEDIHAWPSSPEALDARLRRSGGNPVQYATRLLIGPLLTPEQRAGIYSVLLRTPGARLERGVTTPDGRSGDGVRFVSTDDSSGTDHANLTYDTTLVFDPATHTLIGIRDIYSNDGPTGATRWSGASWSVVLSARRSRIAPTPDFEQRYPAGSHGRQAPTYVPVG